jgi:hypothetical protein
MDFCRFFEPSANLLSEPDKSVTNTLTLSHSAITILTSVKKESSPPFNTRQSQDDSRRLLGAVFLILPLFGCTQPATGPVKGRSLPHRRTITKMSTTGVAAEACNQRDHQTKRDPWHGNKALGSQDGIKKLVEGQRARGAGHSGDLSALSAPGSIDE